MWGEERKEKYWKSGKQIPTRKDLTSQISSE